MILVLYITILLSNIQFLHFLPFLEKNVKQLATKESPAITLSKSIRESPL